MSVCSRLTLILATAALVLACRHTAVNASEETYNRPATRAAGDVVLRVIMLADRDEDPAAAGKSAAQSLKQAMGGVELKAVLVSECFEDREYKEKLLSGICQVLPGELVFGGATYGSFTQEGCSDFDSVCLLGIGGPGVGVSAALVKRMGTAKLSFEEHEQQIEQKLNAAGQKLSQRIQRSDTDRLLILIPDAHSPKNRYLVEGVQGVLGADFPITGGSVNKNAGQTFIYFQGNMYQDSAVAVMLSGDFEVTMSGRLAQDNDAVIRTAREGAAEALEKHASDKPIAVLAYNCAGRRGKLDNMQDELTAIQQAIGRQVPLFGCYNAGEIGPLDASERQPGVRCGGSGWHLMFTMIWKR